MFKKLVVLGACILGIALTVPSIASAGSAFTYQRNGTLINGQLRGECGSFCYTSWYRAGSGSGYDACQTNNWIPLGTYSVPFHQDNYAGSLIQGRVWRLSDYEAPWVSWRLFYLAARVRVLSVLIFNSSYSVGGKSPSSSCSRSSL